MTVRSLAAADSGIQAAQTQLDVIGNNIANVDTDGYKQTTAEFSDLLNQQLTPAGAPVPGLASTNPSAVGSGVAVSQIATNFGEGAIIQTGVPTDVAIEGNGFFVVSTAGQVSYTRAGNFHLDANGTLATADGGEVQGWMAQPGGAINTTAPTTALSIDLGGTVAPVPTGTVALGGNIPAGSTSPVTTTFSAYDQLGNPVPVTLTFTPPTGGGTAWTLQGTVPKAGGGTTDLWATPPTVTFGANGQVSAVSGSTGSATTGFTLPVGTSPTGVPLSFTFPPAGTSGAVTQIAGTQTIAYSTQNGSPGGTLESWSVGPSGLITGTFSDGRSSSLGQIALAGFNNPGGLVSTGNLSYQASASSGQAQVGPAGTGTVGTLEGGALEQSNVNLAGELTDLVSAQTAYQADTKVVSTTDQVLQSLVNMP
ncbi:MAG: flagellar hook protein FlgE [Actinomycetota bacterium]|nr:flagellar hook protein FlgE [Actinomycetota bacterium]